MAFKTSQLFYSTLFFVLYFSAFGHAKRGSINPSHKKPSPFDFKNLQGCHKGNHTKGIHLLKAYFQTFGYLDQTHSKTDRFDQTLEAALKTFQENYHIKPTGTLDATTISRLTTPRCGVPDIFNHTNYMRSLKRSTTNHTVSHYTFFPGNLRWPPSRTHLTYRLLSNVPADAVAPVESAFQKWAAATHFTFSRVGANQRADLEIGFFRGDHGDGAPFGGVNRAIAHAFAPTDGRFHYNGGVSWSVGPSPGAFDLESVAAHEIGHLLGLGHSDVEEAIMYAYISSGVSKTDLNADDIAGIRDLYDV